MLFSADASKAVSTYSMSRSLVWPENKIQMGTEIHSLFASISSLLFDKIKDPLQFFKFRGLVMSPKLAIMLIDLPVSVSDLTG